MHLAISNKNKNTTQNGMQFQGDLSFSRSGRWETRRANQKDSSLRMETMKTGFLWICAMDCATWLLSCQIRILFMLHNSLKGSSSYIQTFTFEKMYSNLLDFLLSPPNLQLPRKFTMLYWERQRTTLSECCLLSVAYNRKFNFTNTPQLPYIYL